MASNRSVPVRLRPVVLAYLDELDRIGGYGKGRASVIRRFVENGIAREINRRVLDKKVPLTLVRHRMMQRTIKRGMKSPGKTKNESSQPAAFRKLARELGCDESEEAFDDKLRVIAKQKQPKEPEPKKAKRS